MPKNESPGILIAVEGIDGAGKTTQVELLSIALRAAGLDVLTSKEPTNGAWGRKIRESAATGRMPVEEELQAFIADRTEHIETLVGPALARGATVILDRYYFSSIAYQGVRGSDPEMIRSEMEARFPIPDLTVILEIDSDLSQFRISKSRGETPNHFEQQAALEKSHGIFSSLSGPGIVRIDGSAQQESVLQALLAAFVDGPLKAKRCAKSYGCDDPFHCTASLTNRCEWITLRRKLAPALS